MTTTQRRNGLLLLAATLLFALAAWLGATPSDAADSRDGPAFPRQQALAQRDDTEADDRTAKPNQDPSERTGDNNQLANKLQLPTHLPKLPNAGDSGARLRRALSAPGHGHLMVNMETLTNSEVVQKLMRCRGGRAMRGFDRIRKETGLDLQRDVRHVGVGLGDDVLAVSGRMAGVRVPSDAQTYGKSARIWELAPAPAGTAKVAAPANGATAPATTPSKAEAPKRQHVALVGDDTLIMADNETELKAAIDRLEGAAPAETSSAGNGDVQGQLLADDIAKLFGQPRAGEQPMVATMRKLAERARLRMNVGSDVAMSIDLNAQPDQGEELAKAVRGGVALMRQGARHSGREDLERLLDRAKVLDADDGQVGFDLAVPGSWILDRFGCDADGNPKQPSATAAATTIKTPAPNTP